MANFADIFENPMVNLGVGLLGASGYSPVPKTLGQVVSEGGQFAQQRQQAILQNQAMRDALAQQKRQREAMAKISQLSQPLPGPVGGPAPIATPQGQQQYMGLLAEAFPEQYIGLLSSQLTPSKPPGNIQTLEYLQQNPELIPAYQELFGQNQQDEQLKSLVTQLQAQQLMQQQEAKTREQREAVGAQKINLQNTVRNIQKMYKLAEDLQGTPLELGTPAAEQLIRPGLSVRSEFSRITGIGDSEQYRKAIADFDEFKKLSSGLTASTFQTMSDLPRAASAMSLLQESQPGLGMSTDANLRVLRTLLEDTLSMGEMFQTLNPDSPLSGFDEARQFLNQTSQGGNKRVKVGDL